MVKKFSLIFFLLLATLLAEAKRGTPAEVLPIKVGNIEYLAPHRNSTHKQMGFIEARDSKKWKINLEPADLCGEIRSRSGS